MPSLPDEIYERLLSDVVAGDRAAGEWLPREQDLAEHYGVARATVRAAIARAAGSGLVEVRHGRGQRVQPDSRWQLTDPAVLSALAVHRANNDVREELIVARERLEIPVAIELAQLSETRRRELTLRRHLDDMGEAARHRHTPVREHPFVRAEAALHHAILCGGGNRVLTAAAAPVHVALATARAVLAAGRRAQTHQRHAELVEAIEVGDSGAAADAFASHVADLRAWLT